ncbi:MAG: hypothetical protein DI637_14040 [Citromicrobium sp.]|nr:MAG: hypothetical protein DI637_14040 [Citromicrobium sp.]
MAYWGRGKLFSCKKCGNVLHVPKAKKRLVLSGTVLFLAMAQSAPWWLLAIILVLVGILEFLLMRVQLIDLESLTEQDPGKPIDDE